MNLESNLRAMFEHMEGILSTKTVFGEPIRAGETTLVPVLTVTFGVGTGGGEGKAETGEEGGGGGAGAGARLVPRAIVAVTGGKVEVFTIGQKQGFVGLVERVPEMMNLVLDKFGPKGAAAANEAAKTGVPTIKNPAANTETATEDEAE